MSVSTNKFLVIGAALSGIAALVHLACLIVGTPLFRLLGAGEQMAQLYLAGHWYPSVITFVIAGILIGWNFYALSGSGLIRKLPLRAHGPVCNHCYLYRSRDRIRTGYGLLPWERHDLLDGEFLHLIVDRRRPSCGSPAVLGEAVEWSGLNSERGRSAASHNPAPG